MLRQKLEKQEMGAVDNKCWEMTESQEGDGSWRRARGYMDGRICIKFCKFNIFMGKNGPSTFITTASFGGYSDWFLLQAPLKRP
jgi:hypothetical protein